jgi:RsiW-degrading membrane proteinase PrsW (M82 family)
VSTYLVILAVLPALLVSYAIFRLDKFEREPLAALLLCFAAGALITVPAVAMEKYVFFQLMPLRESVGGTLLLAFGAVAFNEELFKFAVLMAAAFPYRFFNEPFDGIVYAVLIAMGFASFENLVYANRFGAEAVWLRTFTAVPAHLVFAIVQGYFAGLAKFDPPRRRRLLVRGLATAVLLHGIYDFLIIQQWSSWLIVLATISLYLSLFYCGRLIQEHQDNSPFR